jgi:hypothetical protein
MARQMVTIAGRPPRSARFVSGRQVPVEMVVVFPASKFTSDEGNLAPTLTAVERFVSQARTWATVGLVRYADTVLVSADRMSSLSALLELLKVPFPRPGRVLYDGLVTGVQSLGSTSPRKSIVLLLDGPDSGADRSGGASRHAGSEAVKLVRTKEVEVHVIGFGRDLNLSANLQKNLARLAAATGGTSATLGSAAGLTAALESVRTHLDSQALLEIVPTVEQLKTGLHPLTVKIPGEPDMRLLHRAVVSVR